jgi:hypothetical protein
MSLSFMRFLFLLGVSWHDNKRVNRAVAMGY